MKELDAVNQMLRTIGQVPVRDIPDGGYSDARQALDTLKEYAAELQADGYMFNTDEGLELTPDSQGHIAVPEGTTRITAHYPHERIVERGGKVFDKLNNTYVFKNPIKVDRVYLVAFQDLPQGLQRYTVVRSARVFSNRTVGAGEQNGYNQEDETRARIAWLNEVAVDMDLNLLSSSRHIRPHTYRPFNAISRGLV